MNRYLLISLMLVFLASSFQIQAQDDPIRSRLGLTYLKNSKQDKILSATLKYKEGKKWELIQGVDVNFFYMDGEEEEIELGSATSNEMGTATFKIPEDAEIYVDSTNNISLYLAYFDGNDKFRGSDGEIEIIDIELKINLEVVDSVKTVYLEANEINFDGELIPIEECDITLFVPRLYSDLPIEEGYIEEGEAEFEFPDDIPGRDNGELFVKAKIIEHDYYGDVEVQEEVNWGTPVSFVNSEMPESLFGKAPGWMGILIYGILAAAWYHLFLVLFKLFRIKKLGNN